MLGFPGNREVVTTYHCQSANNLTRGVDVAANELADEVCRHADYGDYGDDTEAARDEEGPSKRGGGGHFCVRLGFWMGDGFFVVVDWYFLIESRRLPADDRILLM